MRSLLKIVAIATIALSAPPIGVFAGEHSSRQQLSQDGNSTNSDDDDDDNDDDDADNDDDDRDRPSPAKSNQGEDHYVDQFCAQPWCPWQPR